MALLSPERKKELGSLWSSPLLFEYPLSRLSSLGVGGPAAAVLFPSSLEELQWALWWLKKRDISWRVIGRGTNILAPDEGYGGVIIVLGKRFAAIERLPESTGKQLVRVEAGCSLPRLLTWCGQQGLAGLEFAAGIPGSVGGAIRMNAGAWGREMVDVLAGVDFIDSRQELVSRQGPELSFGYRRWHGPAGAVVTAGIFALQPAGRDSVLRTMAGNMARRKRKQPQRMRSAGSFFRNPPGRAAGELIEAAGLKGLRIGGAMVSEVHANFIVNIGGASAGDIIEVMRKVQKTVEAHSGLRLEPEVDFIY